MDEIDTRFCTNQRIKIILAGWFEMKFTTKDIQDMLECAKRLEIQDYCTRPSVDVLYDIATRLCIFEKDIVMPEDIMPKIREYLNGSS